MTVSDAKPPIRRSRRRSDAFASPTLLEVVAPYLGIAGAGVLFLGIGAFAEVGWIETPVEWRDTIANLCRSLGGAALIGSVVGPLISLKVQEQALHRVLRNALAAVYGAQAPPKYTRALGRYLGHIERVTTERTTRLELSWANEDRTMLRVNVLINAHGFNITPESFAFEFLSAPGSYGGQKTIFKSVTLRAGEDWARRFELDEEDLKTLVRRDSQGRTRVDLRREALDAVLAPGEEYWLDKSFEVFLPKSWVYVLESYAAHLTQHVWVQGSAVRDLDIGAVVANRRLKGKLPERGPQQHYEIENAIFPGQTTIVSWHPRGPSLIDLREPAQDRSGA